MPLTCSAPSAGMSFLLAANSTTWNRHDMPGAVILPLPRAAVAQAYSRLQALTHVYQFRTVVCGGVLALVGTVPATVNAILNAAGIHQWDRGFVQPMRG